MEQKIITLQFSIDELNQLLTIISEKPFKDVFLIMNKIQRSVQEQMKPVIVPEQTYPTLA
jgi:hypothetical protein